MGMKKIAVTLEQARGIAEREALSDWGSIFGADEAPFLRDFYSEAPHCWIFYRRKELVMPEKYGLVDCAYSVSRQGTLRCVYDYTADPAKAQRYANMLSDFYYKEGQ